MTRIAMPFIFAVALFLAPAAEAQHAVNAVSAELGGASAAATLNVERSVGAGLSVRLGLGALPAHGVDLAVPATVRYLVGRGGLAFELGAGVLVTRLSTEYLGEAVTHVASPAVQAFPMAEGALRRCIGGSLFVRMGGALFYDAYNPRRTVGALPSVGVGVGL